MAEVKLNFKDLKSLNGVASADSPEEFPLEIFSPEFQRIVKETSENNNYPIEVISAFLLGGISSAIGNSCKIQVLKGWKESAILYIVVVGNSGVMKTAPLNFAIDPFVKLNQKAQRFFHKEMESYKAEILKNPLLKETLKKPELFRYVMNDATIEAVAKRHSVNKRSILLYMDELKAFFMNFTRYGKGGSDQQQWLSSFSGTSLQKDRVEDEKSIIIANPHITIMGGIQPEVYKQVFTKDFVHDGMADRFLVFKPQIKQARRIDESKELSDDIPELWEEIIKRIFEIPLGDKPHILSFSQEAKRYWIDWYNSFEYTENDVQSSIDAKIQTYCARFSLILQITKDVFRQGGFRMEVDLESVQGAVRLAEYFKVNAQKMRKEADLLDPVDLLTENEKELYELLPDEFTTGEGQKIVKDTELMGDTTFRTKFLKNKDLFVLVSTGNWRKARRDGSQE